MPDSQIKHEKELIEHLSREITSQTQALIEFRSRINFTIFVGPFIVLGSYFIASKNSIFSITLDTFTWVFITALCLLWVLMGITGSILEEHIWDKCNEWRQAIYRLQTNQADTISENDLLFKHHLTRGYILVHLHLLVAIVLVITILAHQPQSQTQTVKASVSVSANDSTAAKPDSSH